MASHSFRASKWDPIFILAQITSLQSLCYILFSVILYIALTLTGTEVSLDLIFSDKEIRTDTGFGWSLIIVWMVNACLSIPILMYIVQRAKQILDYVLTFHFLHLICVWKVSERFPTGTAWWILQLVNVIIMTLGGEWACMHREMKPILIGKKEDSGAGASSSTITTNRTLPEEDEQQQPKRKRSDATTTTEQEEDENMEDDQEGALLSAVRKVKKALMMDSSSSSKSKQRTSKKYDLIPMNDIDHPDDSSSQA